MREINIDYVKKFMVNANEEIDDSNGNWYGVKETPTRLIVTRNGYIQRVCKTYEAVVKYLKKEGC